MQRFNIEREVLGSKIRAIVVDDPAVSAQAEAALLKCMEECERIEQAFSRFRPDSELSLVNKRLNEWTTISEELYRLLRFGEEMHRVTDGAFDQTVKSILEGWGYDAEYSLKENQPGQLGEVRLRDPHEVYLTAEIDLGGVGKGYALDRMLLFLKDFPNVLLDAGGDLYARGTDEAGQKWRIIFEHPTDINRGIGQVEADDLFLAASSPSRRRWRGFHHLVDPATHQPANDMLMTYVQAKKGIIADSLATALFVMGADKARYLLPSLGVEAMLVNKEGKFYKTPGFQGKLFTS